MRQSQSPSSSSSSSSSCKVLSRSDLLVFMAPENDIPHLRMSCTHYEDESSLLYFDLLPRVDLVANIDYYDAYYQVIVAFRYYKSHVR